MEFKVIVTKGGYPARTSESMPKDQALAVRRRMEAKGYIAMVVPVPMVQPIKVAS